jgi:uncharacterized C2H2 Zn-finger protein
MFATTNLPFPSSFSSLALLTQHLFPDAEYHSAIHVAALCTPEWYSGTQHPIPGRGIPFRHTCSRTLYPGMVFRDSTSYSGTQHPIPGRGILFRHTCSRTLYPGMVFRDATSYSGTQHPIPGRGILFRHTCCRTLYPGMVFRDSTSYSRTRNTIPPYM